MAELPADFNFQIQEERDENQLSIGPHMEVGDTTTTTGLFSSFEDRLSRSTPPPHDNATSVRYSRCHSESTTCVSPLSESVDMSPRIEIVEERAISPDGTVRGV